MLSGVTDRDAAWAELHAAAPLGWWVGTFPRLLVSAMLIGLLTTCASPVPSETGSTPAPMSPEASLEAPWAPDGKSVDPVTAHLLRRYGLVPRGPTTTMNVRLGELDELPWALYLEASREIGLGRGWRPDTAAKLRQTPVVSVAGVNGGRVHVLITDAGLAGAWMSDDATVPGLHALSAGP
jgi:hypothetical protein